MDNRRQRRLDAHHRATHDRLAQLDAEMAQLRADRGSEGADDEHDPEGVTLSAEWSRLEGLREAVAREAADADTALARAADGTYGTCDGCGADIPEARLDVRPAATQCVACAAGGTENHSRVGLA